MPWQQADKQKISLTTLVIWMTVVRTADVFHFFDEFQTPAGHAGWIAILMASLWVGIAITIVYFLSWTFPGKSLAEASEYYLGRLAGKAVNLLLAWFFLHQGAVGLRSLTDAIATVILPRTPPIVVSGLLVWVTVFAVRGGIEVVGRSALPIFLGMLGAVAGIAIFIVQEAEFGRLLPLLGPGMGSIATSSLYVAALAPYVLLLPMFLAMTQRSKGTFWILQAKNLFVHGFIAFAFVLVASTMSYTATHQKVFEFLSLVRFISVGNFIERIDPLLLAGWVSTGYAAVAAFFMGSLAATRILLGLKDYRPISFPMAVLLIILSELLFENTRERTGFVGFGEAVVPYNLLFIFVFPLVLLPVFHLRRRAMAAKPRG